MATSPISGEVKTKRKILQRDRIKQKLVNKCTKSKD